MSETYGHSTESIDLDSAKTIEKYERILEQDPSSSTFVFLAQILYKQSKLEQATGVLIKGLRYNKNNITGRFLLGKIYYERWMIDLAKKELERVFALAPDNLAAGKMLVEIYKSEEEFERALEVLNYVHEFHPSDAGIREGIEIVRANLEKSAPVDSKGGNTWENFSAPDVNSDNINTDETSESTVAVSKAEIVTETMADIYIQQGEYEKGIRVFQKILEKEPENSSVRMRLAECRTKVINKTAGFS